MYIWEPGVNPIVNGEVQWDKVFRYSASEYPQETISFRPIKTGDYTIGVHAYNVSRSGDIARYSIDWSGQISNP